jgi:hypothetical protein
MKNNIGILDSVISLLYFFTEEITCNFLSINVWISGIDNKMIISILCCTDIKNTSFFPQSSTQTLLLTQFLWLITKLLICHPLQCCLVLRGGCDDVRIYIFHIHGSLYMPLENYFPYSSIFK